MYYTKKNQKNKSKLKYNVGSGSPNNDENPEYLIRYFFNEKISDKKYFYTNIHMVI